MASREKLVRRSRRGRTWRRATVALLLVVASARAPLAQETAPTEYELKAAFLYNFSKFVDWPPATLTADAPFKLCVIGKNPFGKSLEQMQSKTVGGHPIQFVQLSDTDSLQSCQILFVSSSEKKRVSAIVETLQGKPVLTVGDTPGFAKAGITINFLLEEDQVRFEINLKAAEQAHLNFSSRLLALARSVIRA